MNKVIQIKCVAKCKMCKEEKGLLSAFEYSSEMFSMSRKAFYEFAPLSRKKPSKTDQFVSANKSEISVKR